MFSSSILVLKPRSKQGLYVCVQIFQDEGLQFSLNSSGFYVLKNLNITRPPNFRGLSLFDFISKYKTGSLIRCKGALCFFSAVCTVAYLELHTLDIYLIESLPLVLSCVMVNIQPCEKRLDLCSDSLVFLMQIQRNAFSSFTLCIPDFWKSRKMTCESLHQSSASHALQRGLC